MPGRYEIVDEPEALEVDDDVYHPDHTVRDVPGSARSLEPIVDGPITMKTIFMDPRWSPTQRKCCLGVIVVTCFICFSILITLVVGLGRVLSYIEHMEAIRGKGLMMVPSDAGYQLPNLIYNPSPEFEPFILKYAELLDGALDVYRNNQSGPAFVDCTKENPKLGEVCKFDLSLLGENCTKENNYGYKAGNPCVLFVLRNIDLWQPHLTQADLKTFFKDPRMRPVSNDTELAPLRCYPSSPRSVQPELVYYPDGFSITNLPTRTGPGGNGLPPLVMVQLIKPHAFRSFKMTCQVFAQNVKDLPGVTQMEFEFQSWYLPEEDLD